MIGLSAAGFAFEFFGFVLNFFNGVENVWRFGINGERGKSFEDFGNLFEFAGLLKGDKAFIEHIEFFGTCRRLQLFH